MEHLLSVVLEAAVTGLFVSAGPGAVFSTFASATPDNQQQPSPHGLAAGQIIRAFFHAAAVSKQAQPVLVNIQSAAASCTAAVPLLLHALDNKQRHQLQQIITSLAQQQYALHHPPQQQLPPQQVQPWVQQLEQLCVWDVLLLLGMWGDPQLEMDVCMVLLRGLRDMTSLDQLFADLATVSVDAAEWLLDVGVTWATTCYLDVPEDDILSFEQGGSWLLRAGICANPHLAKQGMCKVLQKLIAEDNLNTALWGVLQYVVSRCNRTLLHYHRKQQKHQQQHQYQEQQRHVSITVEDNPGNSSSSSDREAVDSDVAAVCVQQLLAVLPAALQHHNTELTMQYVSLIGTLAAYSCEASHAMLAACKSLLQLQPGDQHGQAERQLSHQLPGHRQQLAVKQEMQECNVLEGGLMQAAAVAATLTDGATAGTSAAAGVEQSPSATPQPCLSSAVTPPLQVSWTPMQGAEAASQQRQPYKQLQRSSSEALHGKAEELLHTLEVMLHNSSKPAAGSPADDNPNEQLVEALLCAVLQHQTPCCSSVCQQQLAGGLQDILCALSATSIQRLAGNYKQQMQHKLGLQEQRLSTQIQSEPHAGSLCMQQPSQPAAASVVDAAAGEVFAATSAPDSTRSSVQGLWQQTLLQLLQQQVEQLVRSAADTADTCAKGHASSKVTHLPIVLGALLRSLASDSAEPLPPAVTAAPATVDGLISREQQQQPPVEQPQLRGTALAEVMLQLVALHASGKLFTDDRQTAGYADDSLMACAHGLRLLLLRYHTLSGLLVWLLQHDNASKQVLSETAAAGAMGSAEDATTPCGSKAAEPLPAAVDATVEVDGRSTDAVACQLQEALLDASAVADHSCISQCGTTQPFVDIVLELQELRSVLLPNAANGLLAAIQHPAAARQDGNGMGIQPQQTPTADAGNCMQTVDATALAVGTGPGTTTNRKSSCSFFVVHTPAEKQAAAAHDSHPILTASGANAGCAQQQGLITTRDMLLSTGVAVSELLPRPILQLPQVPLQLCQQLLTLVNRELHSLLKHLQHVKQLVGARSALGIQQQSHGRSSCRVRRSRSAGHELQRQDLEAPEVSGSQSEHQAGYRETSQSGQTASTCATDGESADAIIDDHEQSQGSPTAAVQAAERGSGQAGSLQSSSLTTSIQQMLRCAEFVVASSATWTHQCSAGVQSSHHTASGATHAPQAQEATYQTAVLLLQLHNMLTLSKLPALGVNMFSSSPGAVPVQHMQRLACTAMSTAAELLEVWWVAPMQAGLQSRGASLAGSSCRNDFDCDSVRSRQHLASYLQQLGEALASAACDDNSKSSGPLLASTGVTLSWSDVALVFGHGVGSISWSAIKRLQQQEQLLAVLLSLLVKVHHVILRCGHSKVGEACGDVAGPEEAAVFTGLLQQLAVLSAIARDVYSTTAGAASTGAGSSVGGPAWLLRLLTTACQKLVTGPLLPASFISTPAAASALFRLCQRRHLRQLPSTQVAATSTPTGPSSTLALAAHLLCLHHGPRVYAAAETCIWGKEGLAAALHDQGPRWMKGCSRDVAAAAARTSLLLLAQDIPQNWTRAAAAGDMGMAAGGDGLMLPPNQQSVMFWQSCAAAVAAVCDCCELLLHQQALLAKQYQRQQQLAGDNAAPNSSIKAASRTLGTVVGPWCGQQQCSDLQLVVESLAAVLSGPCSAAAKHMTALLDWCVQQQQQQQHADTGPGALGQKQNGEAALQSGTPAVATAEGNIGAVQTKRKPVATAQRKRIGAAACQVSRVQLQLSMLLGLGCAIGKMVLAKRSLLLQTFDQQQKLLFTRAADARSHIRQLLYGLREFNDAYQSLTQALREAADATTTAAAAEGSAGADSTDELQESSTLLESAADRCAGSSRKEAWAAVAAAAALLQEGSSSGSGSDSEAEDEQATAGREGQGVTQQCQPMDARGTGTSSPRGPAAVNVTDASARFYDPEVHEELPCSDLSSSESDDDEDRDEDKDQDQDGDEAANQEGTQFDDDLAACSPQQSDGLQQDLTAAFGGKDDVRQQARAQLKAVFRLSPAQANQQQQQQLGSQQAHNKLQSAAAWTPLKNTSGTAALAVAAARAAAAAGRLTPSQQQQQQQQLSQSPQVAAAPASTPQQQHACTAVEAARSQLELSFGKASAPAAAAVRVWSPAAVGPSAQQQCQVSVICGDKQGSFDISSQQVTLPDGRTLTPSAFERLGGKGNCKKWRKSLRVVVGDGQQHIALGSWLKESAADNTAIGSGNDVEPLQPGSRKRRLSQTGSPQQVTAAVAASQQAAPAVAADVADDVPSTAARSAQKARHLQRVGQEPSPHAAAVLNMDKHSRGADSLLQQQQQPKKALRRLVAVPVHSRKAHGRQEQSEHSRKQPKVVRCKQQQKAQLSADGSGRVRNAFVQACLAEDRLRRSTAVMSDEESEDDSDYSDLEDFIVVQRDIDYSRLCSEAGGRVSWKHRWQQRPGAAGRKGVIT